MERLPVKFVLLCGVVVLAGCSCPNDFITFQESCYWFSNIKANFAEARAYCGFLKSHLAVITSKEEDDFVRETARRKSGEDVINIWQHKGRFYLGATDLAKQGVWKWEGGLNMMYTNWGPGEPSSAEERCLDLLESKDYLWNDDLCSYELKFICERCFQ